MFTNFYISPINFSNSIFLTFQAGQPFASFGSKTLVPGVTSICLPSAPPEDNQPRGLVTEFLTLGYSGDIGKPKFRRRIEAGPADKRKNLYRVDPRSQYAEPILDLIYPKWNTATVSFEGKSVRMIWQDIAYLPNPQATSLAQQEDAVLPPYVDKSSITVGYNAYLVLSQMWKPVVDIRTTKYPLASDFEREVKPHIGGWWHAVKIDNGWRLYADDKDVLFWAKIKYYI